MEISQVGHDPNAASSVASAKLTENFDTFLRLLTTQLQNQDPLSPMESNEFVNQLVQFSEVEQAIASNKSLETLIDLQTTNQATAALSYIGSKVEASGSRAPLQDSKAEFTYTLGESADATLLIVRDEIGKVVYSTPGEKTTGKHGFVWDGKDASGTQMPDGNYRLTVTARDADGALLDVDTTALGRVTGVESGVEGVLLTLGGVKIPVGSVLSIQEQEKPAS